MRWVISAIVVLVSWPALAQQPAPSYARDIRPFLAKYCLECHNARVMKGDLDLETYKVILEGGERGPVLVPGQPDKSKLVQLVEGKAKPIMPPQKVRVRPGKKEIALLRAWVAAGARDDSGSIKVTLPTIKPHNSLGDPIRALAYTADGTLLIAHGNAVARRGVSAASRAGPPGSTVSALAVSTRRLAVAVTHPSLKAEILLFSTEQPPARIAHAPLEHPDAVLDLAFSPDGKTLASAGYDARITLIDAGTGKKRLTLKEHSDSVYGLAFSPDSKLLASCGADRALKISDVETGKLLYTLGQATDWLYTVAWSPDGAMLATAGVDKSIRVYRPKATGAKIVRSVFAHEAPVQKLLYAPDSKTLYSAGQDGVLKAWDAARMVETRIYPRQSETILSLAVHPGGEQIAVGRFDGVVEILDTKTGKVLDKAGPFAQTPAKELPGGAKFLLTGGKKQEQKAPAEPADPFPMAAEREPNNSPGAGQTVKVPASIHGKLDRAGETDYYRFDAPAGYELGVHVVPAKNSKLVPYLQLLDAQGKLLGESDAGHLGHRFAGAGVFTLGVRDREFRGGADFTYRLHLGNIPVVSAVFPLGLQQNTSAEIQIDGVNLVQKRIKVQAKGGAGTKLSLTVKTATGKPPLGNVQVVVGEFPEVSAQDQAIPVPGTANGRLLGEQDTWTFPARKGQMLVVEVEAQRLGAPLDSILEILDKHDQPIERARLRCQAKTVINFRDHDSVTNLIRIDAWDELAMNDYIYAGTELMRIQALPGHPDANCEFFSEGGKRVGYEGTTPTHHSIGTPMYKVAIHPPGTKFSPNGFPVFTLYYRNDDGGSGYGGDSRIFFDPPADDIYKVRIRDCRGQSGPAFVYRLTVRPPRPSFNVRMTPTSFKVPRGGAIPVKITAERLDDYNGPIQLEFGNVPAGFHVPATALLPDENNTTVALFAEESAKSPMDKTPFKLVAHAIIAGQKVVREISAAPPEVADPADITTYVEEQELAIKPGGKTKLTVRIKRGNGFAGRVPLDVRGLPHGMTVLDLGLNGILINEREERRTIVLQAESWLESAHPFVVLGRREGKNTEHAAKSVVLKIAK